MPAIKKALFKIIPVPDYILDSMVFELQSFLGRAFTGTLKLNRTNSTYINLGCGPNVIKGFVNIDFFFRKHADFGADLRFPLNVPDQSVGGILCEHTMEHLTYSQNEMLFKECFRIMKSGAILRIIVPDISLFIHHYANNNSEWFKKYEQFVLFSSEASERKNRKFATPMQAMSFVTQEYHHVSCWDFETFRYYLENTGFRDIQKVGFRTGRNKDLLQDRDDAGRKHVSIYLEAVKP